WELFASAKETYGWLSIDPFRLYPGAYVHEAMKGYTRAYGTKFYHPRWWTSWYDGPFRAEHIDPSTEVDFEARVRFMFTSYRPLIEAIGERFRGQGRSVDRVFQKSLMEQREQLSPESMNRVLVHGQRAKDQLARAEAGGAAPKSTIAFPIGLHVRDPNVRIREESVRRLLERGVLRTDALVEALLTVAPEDHLGEETAQRLLRGKVPDAPATDGDVPDVVSFILIAMALEALEPGVGDVVADMTAASSYVTALLSQLVGPNGRIVSVTPAAVADTVVTDTVVTDTVVTDAVVTGPNEFDNVTRVVGDPTRLPEGGPFDRIAVFGALPTLPRSLRNGLIDPGGRITAFVGPRFRPQDLIVVARQGDEFVERVVARARVPVLRGRTGWLRAS
ncbi:MAG: protein-L-isoaspartate O-methyltransferase, partial [Myxococcota bacterium]